MLVFFFSFDNIKTGSYFLSFFIHPFIEYLNLSFFNINLIFAIIGFLGFYNLYHVGTIYLKNNIKLYLIFIIILFLPNHHYWTSYISKDVFNFYFITLYLSFCFQEDKSNKKLFLLIILFIYVLLLRPYIGIIFLTCHVIIFVFMNKFHKNKLLLIIIASSLIIYFIYQFGSYIYYIDISETNFISALIKYFNNRLAATSQGFSLDYENRNFIFRIIGFLFIPLSLQSLTIQNLIIFLNNVVELTLFVILLLIILTNLKKIKNNIKLLLFKSSKKIYRLSLLLFGIILLILLSNTLSNYGIIMRQKTNFIYIFYFYILIILSKIRLRKND